MKKHIPNLFTFGNLLCGFLSIPYIVERDVINAVLLLFIAMILDAIDGRAARILKVSNDLGKQLDSLADVVSFGVAPALLAAYTFYSNMGMYSVAFVAIFPLAGAFRLARFNITPTEESIHHFKGVPITLAGGVVAVMTLFADWIPVWVFTGLFLALAWLMISTISIPSFKKVRIPKNGVFLTFLIVYFIYFSIRSSISELPIFFYLALVVYISFVIVRYIKVREPIQKVGRKRFRIISKRKATRNRKIK